MRYGILGSLEVVDGSGQVVALGGGKQRAVLALLLLDAGSVVPVSALVDAIWGDDPPATARKTIQVYVSNLRKAVGAAQIVTGDQGYLAAVAPDALDLLRFRDLVTRATAAAGLAGHRRASELLTEGLSLWRGTPLAGLGNLPFVGPATTLLEDERLRALEARIAADLAVGRHEAVIGELERLVLRHPLREPLVGHLMAALYGSGRQADALRVFADARERLGRELGVDAGRALRELHGRILRQDPVLSTSSRSKRHDLPVLPAALTTFIGRDRERREIAALLDDHPLVTVTGAAGAGKTRLALEVAAAMADRFPDGRGFAGLAGLEDGAAVPGRLATALHLTSDPGRSTFEGLTHGLAGRRVLVVLDDCEHVAGACARLAHHVLQSCREVRFLATSRTPLGVSGEVVYRLDPLPVPETGASQEEIVASPSVALFVERASRARPDFELREGEAAVVADLCRRVAGLPLAIELAATWLRVLPVERLRDELARDLWPLTTAAGEESDAPQVSLYTAISRSYELCSERQRSLLRRLSVFRGGFTLGGAAAVCGDEAAPEGGEQRPPPLLSRVAELVDRSLVVRPDDRVTRYQLLRPVRLFAAEKLRDSGAEAQTRQRHLEHFVAFVERGGSQMQGGDGAAWADRFAVEHDNLRAALRWALRAGDATRARQLAHAAAQVARQADEPAALSLTLPLRDVPATGVTARDAGPAR